MADQKPDRIREFVRERYGNIARTATSCCGPSPTSSCCGPSSPFHDNASEQMGYSKEQLDTLPEGADLGLGCGNPHTFSRMRPGETVLDLGSGGGIDCFLAAKAVGDTGRVIGVDMTADMVSKARENAEKMGAANVEFRLGEIEHLPVADNSIDVILSNCVINLSPNKLQVFRDALRVLKPGGRLAISDMVALQAMPEEMRRDVGLLTGCVAGAAEVERIQEMLAEAGFEDIRVAVEKKSGEVIAEWFPGKKIEDYVASARIEAVKPRPAE